MAIIRFKGIGIKAISACVPKKVSKNSDLGYLIPEEEIEKTINSIGIKEKRIADKDVTSSDLCFKAAKKLLEDNQINPSEINALIFVSQTSDYHQPATAPILQNRLGLGIDTLCFDVNLACSGYVYGMSIAYSFASQNGIKKVLLLVGETMSKIVSPYDKESAPLFGDAGTATLIEKGEYGDSIFSMHSDGSGSEVMIIPDGGFRNPTNPSTFDEEIDKNGNRRTKDQFRMNGMEVFNFGMRVEPKDLKTIVAEAGLTFDDIDLLIYHQANKFMTDFFTKRIKFTPEKTPYSLDRFGNTSSASIPLTIVSELKNKYPQREKVLVSGFGAGLSWGSAIINLQQTAISELVEY